MLNAKAVRLEIWVQLPVTEVTATVEAEAEADLDSPAELQVIRRAKAKAREPPARHRDFKFRVNLGNGKLMFKLRTPSPRGPGHHRVQRPGGPGTGRACRGKLAIVGTSLQTVY
jgi:hypothetical protein